MVSPVIGELLTAPCGAWRARTGKRHKRHRKREGRGEEEDACLVLGQQGRASACLPGHSDTVSDLKQKARYFTSFNNHSKKKFKALYRYHLITIDLL